MNVVCFQVVSSTSILLTSLVVPNDNIWSVCMYPRWSHLVNSPWWLRLHVTVWSNLTSSCICLRSKNHGHALWKGSISILREESGQGDVNLAEFSSNLHHQQTDWIQWAKQPRSVSKLDISQTCWKIHCN